MDPDFVMMGYLSHKMATPVAAPKQCNAILWKHILRFEGDVQEGTFQEDGINRAC